MIAEIEEAPIDMIVGTTGDTIEDDHQVINIFFITYEGIHKLRGGRVPRACLIVNVEQLQLTI